MILKMKAGMLLLVCCQMPLIFADTVLNDSVTCAECADETLDWRRYRNFAIQHCFRGFEETEGGVPGYLYIGDAPPGTEDGISYDPGPDSEDSCLVHMEYNAAWLYQDKVFFTICGQSGPNPDNDCVTAELHYDTECFGFENIFGTGLDICLSYAIKDLNVMVRGPDGEEHHNEYGTTNRGDFPGVLPSVDPDDVPYPDGAVPPEPVTDGDEPDPATEPDNDSPGTNPPHGEPGHHHDPQCAGPGGIMIF